MDKSTSQIEYTIAGNMGNMIGQLSLQIAKLQTAVQQKNAENDQLKIENETLRKKVNAHESSTNNTDNRQKHSGN
ncbi:hypothetical protein EFP68_01280 [Lactobacillus helveticus]|uniref:hypothetical protein n=1 Tax=Lactobacillus helveticus TaxID=1587 RepID=UPI001C1E23AB|nr:hypothetical protein [Lactobacillus helveticus]MBU5980034.1 hypothetical protein [Lactobacillus helveticus]MCT3413377.1 hypothetical protein [Lactobacillus helveticus]